MRRPIPIIAAILAGLVLLAGCGAEVVHTTGGGGEVGPSGPEIATTAPVPSPPAGLNRHSCSLVNPRPDTSNLLSFGDIFDDTSTTGGTQDSDITFVPGLCIPSGLGPNCDMAFPWYSPETIAGAFASEGLTDMLQVTIFSMGSQGTVTETRLEFNPNESDLYVADAKNCGATAAPLGEGTRLVRTVAPDVYEYVVVSIQVAVGVVFDHMALTAAQRLAIFNVAVTRGKG